MRGTYSYCALQLRLHRRFLLAWLIPLLAIPITFIPAFVAYYGNSGDRQGLVTGMNSNMGIRAMYGTIGDPKLSDSQPTTLGQLLAWEGGMLMVILGAIMAVLLILSSYRRPESSSLAELPRSVGISRRGTTGGSLLLLTVVSAIYGFGAFAGCASMSMLYDDVSIAGSAAFGLTMFCTTLASGVLAALVTLLVNGPNSVLRAGLLTVGLGFLIRAAADTNDSIEWMNAVTPLGWLRVFSPFTHNNWIAMFLSLVGAAVGAGMLVTLDGKRQFNTGLLPEGRREARAPRKITSPLQLRLLLDRGTRFTWSVVAGSLALFFASLTGSIGSFLDQDPTSAEAFKQMFPHQQLEAAFLTYTADLGGILIAIAGITVALHYRKEEKNGELELQLSAGIPRRLAMQLTAASSIVTCCSAVAMATVGASIGALIGSADNWKTGILANVSQAGPALVFAAIAVAIIGMAPRLSALSWLPLIVAAGTGLFGSLFHFPEWLIKASAFGHTLDYSSGLEGRDFLPLLIMAAVAVVGFAVGIWASARRDTVR